MRILIVSTFFPPQNSIASLRPYSWAKFWTTQGHDVTVLTTKKALEEVQGLPLKNNGFQILEVDMPWWLRKVKKGYQSDLQKSEGQKCGIIKKSLIDFYQWLRFKRGLFNATRLPDWSHFWIKPAIEAVRKEEPWDIVVSTAGPYSVHLIGEKLKKEDKAKLWVADYRDNWSDSFVYPGLFPFTVFERIIENRILKHADLLTAVSNSLADGYRKRFPDQHIATIENGFDTDDLDELDPESIFPKDGKKRILYAGTIYLGKRDPSLLFEAIAEMASEENALLNHLEVIFIGLHQANLSELIDRYQVGQWVKSLGFQDRQNSLRMQRDADLLLFLPWNDPQVDGVLTGKIYEYLFSGTPIISVGCPHKEASQRLIEEAGCGMSLLSVKSIKEFLVDFLQNEAKKVSVPNATVLNRYSRKDLALKLLSMVRHEV